MSNIVLENADCFEWLKNIPTKSVDLVLIDPPYNISRKTTFKQLSKNPECSRFGLSYDFGDWDKKDLDIDTLMSELYRVLKNGGTMICFYDIFKLESLKNAAERYKFKQFSETTRILRLL